VTSSINFVLKTRTIKEVKNINEKNISSGWCEKKCLSFSPPTPTRGHLERVGFGQIFFFNFCYLIRVEHEKALKCVIGSLDSVKI
jgi:hypothetical protein